MGIRKNRLMRIISLAMALLLLLLTASCGGSAGEPAENKPDKPGASNTLQESDAKKDGKSDQDQSNADDKQDAGMSAASEHNTPSDSYTAYVEAKAELSSLLIDALSSNDSLIFESMELLGVVMVDLLVMPAGFMGLGEVAAISGLGIIGATDVKYEENGNQYKMTYTNSEGETTEFKGTYDAAKDALFCEVTTENNSGIVYEYCRVPFGYAGQVYTYESDSITELYQFAIHDKGGVIGLADNSKKPAALTGGESSDFPKSCPQWYAIDGTSVTCVTSDGDKYEFEYIPPQE